jgi:predicted GTPase
MTYPSAASPSPGGPGPDLGAVAPLAALAIQLNPEAAPMLTVVRQLARRAGEQVAREVRERLNMCAGMLVREQVKIVFGGHFSSGKSTLINMLIGQPLLPTSDYPETGVACAITAGTSDRIRIRDGLVMLGIPFSTESIAKYVSLIGEDGDYREAVRTVTEVDITLAKAPAGPGVTWIDSPGINDTPEMTRRAAAVAADSDVLVWVVNSRQPVAEVEQELLSERIRTHGAASVVFVVNAFLEADTHENWRWFLAERAPYHQQRIATIVDTGQVAQQVVFTSARAAMGQAFGYGVPEVRALLRLLSDPGQPRVMATRTHRVQLELAALIDDLAKHASQEQVRLAAARAARQAEVSAAGQRRAAFTREVSRAVASAFTRYHGPATDLVTEAGAAAGTTLGYDNQHGLALTASLRTVSGHLAGDIVAAVNRCATQFGQGPLGPDDVSRLGKLLEPRIVAAALPQGKSQGGTAGAFIGGAIGSILAPGLGTAIGAGLGGLIGGGAGGAARIRKDKVAAKATMLAAGSAAVDRMFGSKDEILALVRQACQPAGSWPEPDQARLKYLQMAAEQVKRQALAPVTQAVARQQSEIRS